MIQRVRALPASTPYSSPTRPWSGYSAWIRPRISRSIPWSATVTNVRSGLRSRTRSRRKCAMAISSAASHAACANASHSRSCRSGARAREADHSGPKSTFAIGTMMPATCRPRGISVAAAGARVRERAVRRVELPAPSRLAQAELDDAVGDRGADAAVGNGIAERPECRSPRPRDELDQPALVVAPPFRVLRGEPFVVVVVAVQDQVCAAVVQRVPERPDMSVRAVLAAAEPWVVEQRQGAWRPAGRQVVPEPAHLRRIGVAPAFDTVARRVEDDDVPRPDILGVPRAAVTHRPITEVRPVALGAPGLVLVIARDRELDPVLEPPPRRAEAVAVLALGPVLVRVVPEREHDPGQRLHECRRVVVRRRIAAADVTGPDQDDLGREWRGPAGRGCRRFRRSGPIGRHRRRRRWRRGHAGA